MNSPLQASKPSISIILFFVTLLVSGLVNAQEIEVENKGSVWLGATAQKKVAKRWRLSVSPEIRTDGFTPDRYYATVAAKYRPIDYLALRAGYRFGANDRREELEFAQRFNLDVLGMLPLGNFEPNVRLRYTAALLPGREDNHRLRYRAGIEYRIKKLHLTPELSVEAFHNLNSGLFGRMRYAAFLDFRFYKNKKKKIEQSVGLGYHLDYQLQEYLNTHVIRMEYKIEF